MVHPFKGLYSYDADTVGDWNNDSIGVYYIGEKNAKGTLTVFYIGRAIADGGVRGRLLQHLGESKWRDATHFGYQFCDSDREAIDWEKSEIAKYKPKYNTHHV